MSTSNEFKDPTDCGEPGWRRRSVLALGATAGLALVTDAWSAAADSGQPSAIRYVVTDRRHPASLALGRQLLRTGSTRLEITDGFTRLWEDVLLPHWRDAEAVPPVRFGVAGLTSHAILSCLTEQARSHGRRPVALAPLSNVKGFESASLISWVIT